MKVLLKNGIIITMNRNKDVLKGDILIEEGVIKKIATDIQETSAEIINISDKIVLPGFVQSHVHLSQTLFRNMVENLSLLKWLGERIYKLESLHTPFTLRISAMLGITEMIKTGVTTIIDFGNVKNYEVILETIQESGIRAGAGKVLMDKGPSFICETTEDAISETVCLLEKWHGKHERIFYLLEPRFFLSCSETLLKEIIKISFEKKVKIHTHVSENKEETKIMKIVTGRLPFEYYQDIGMVGSHVFFAHAVWVEEKEIEIIARTNTGIVHCPTTNLKLASGIASVPEFLEKNIVVGIGSDGAPANNNLDIFQEMKIASLIQKPLYGADAMNPISVLEMATINGAKLLGIEHITGSIEEGKKADLVVINMKKIHSFPYDDVYSAVVFSASPVNVEMVMVDGRKLFEDGRVLIWDEERLLREAEKAKEYLFDKV